MPPHGEISINFSNRFIVVNNVAVIINVDL